MMAGARLNEFFLNLVYRYHGIQTARGRYYYKATVEKAGTGYRWTIYRLPRIIRSEGMTWERVGMVNEWGEFVK